LSTNLLNALEGSLTETYLINLTISYMLIVEHNFVSNFCCTTGLDVSWTISLWMYL